MKSAIKWIGMLLGGLIVLSVLAGLVLYFSGMKKLNRMYLDLAVETVNIPAGADAVAHGKHVATIWACTRCHGEDLRGMVITSDPLSGLVPLSGTVIAANLTSGTGGIARSYTDDDWVRAIRHGIMPDGHVEVFMFDYSTLSDGDLGDLIAYLKQVLPVDTTYPEMSYGSIVPIITNIGLFTPAAERIDHGAARPADPTPGATVEYGEYLSAICIACHGNSINSTVKKWKQDEFINTFHTGVLPDGKRFGPTMSANTFLEMSDMELTALWLYYTNSK